MLRANGALLSKRPKHAKQDPRVHSRVYGPLVWAPYYGTILDCLRKQGLAHVWDPSKKGKGLHLGPNRNPLDRPSWFRPHV